MIKQALEFLVSLRAPVAEIKEIHGHQYSLLAGNHPHMIKVPVAGSVQLPTLTGFADAVTMMGQEVSFIHISGPNDVRAYGEIANGERTVLATASCANRFGKIAGGYMDQDSFILQMMTRFVPAKGDHASVLATVGSLQAQAVRIDEDDGVTQVAVAKRGSKLLNVAIKNPIELYPYRTFPEIDQPPALYVLRVKTDGDKPQVGLFYVEDGAWEDAAVRGICEWLRNRIRKGDVPTIG